MINRRNFFKVTPVLALSTVTTMSLGANHEMGISMHSVTSIKELIDIDITLLDTIVVKGYHKINDGGGGVFYWDAHSSEIADDGIFFKSITLEHGRWVRIFDSSIDPRWFGAKLDGITNDTKAINTAIVTASKLRYKLEFHGKKTLVDYFILLDNTRLIGNGITVVQASSGSLLKASTNLSISDLSILDIIFENKHHDNSSLMDFGFKDLKLNNVNIERCTFIQTGSSDNIICIGPYSKNLYINNCTFQGVKDFEWHENNNINAQSLIIQKNFSKADIFDNSTTINGCRFIDGGYGLRAYGKGLGLRNFIITNNYFEGQNIGGFMGYHGANYKVSNNTFFNITAPKRKNNDGAVCWLDESSYHRSESFNYILFENNTIKDCVGNAIYCESLPYGVITNNLITNIKKRNNDPYTILIGKKKYISNGGNGLLVTAGVHAQYINNKRVIQCEGNGVLIHFALGTTFKHGRVMGIIIKDNIIENIDCSGTETEKHKSNETF